MTNGASNASSDTGRTIDADMAMEIAAYLRGEGVTGVRTWREWADALDPPKPSLRDEVAAYLEDILALVRERIAALPCCECKGRGQSSRHGVTDLVPCWVCDAGRATSPPISRRDVLAMFGGDDE